jgi:uncharacterized membrane protein
MSPARYVLISVRLLAALAAGIAAYLLSVSLSEAGLPAGSRWASVFGISVTIPALVAYLGLLAASVPAGSSQPSTRAVGWFVMALLAGIIGVAAVWFVALQAFVLKTWCPWCLAEHGVGLLLAVLIFATFPRDVSLVPGVSRRLSLVACVMLGLFGVGLLAAGQALGPAPKSTLIRLPSDRNADSGPGPGRQISVLNGSLPLVVADEPVLGDPQAKHLVVILFDYCCPHCRETHGHLLDGMTKYPNQYALVLLPMPLDKSCNVHVEETEPRFQDACELARLALAVWKADRMKFAEFDRRLFEPEQPRPLAEARAKAVSLIGQENLAAALRDPEIEKTLQRNIAAYDRSTAGRIPVILSPEFATIVGRPADAEELFGILETELKLQVGPAVPGREQL